MERIVDTHGVSYVSITPKNDFQRYRSVKIIGQTNVSIQKSLEDVLDTVNAFYASQGFVLAKKTENETTPVLLSYETDPEYEDRFINEGLVPPERVVGTKPLESRALIQIHKNEPSRRQEIIEEDFPSSHQENKESQRFNMVIYAPGRGKSMNSMRVDAQASQTHRDALISFINAPHNFTVPMYRENVPREAYVRTQE